MSQLNQCSWLLLLHQIPPDPPYFRAKVLRRLNALGALAIKNSAYMLPETVETVEDMEWIRSEIAQQGGSAWLFQVAARGGVSDEELRESFRSLRADGYKQLLDSAAALLEVVEREGEEAAGGQAGLRKLQRGLEEIRKIDFFGAPGREEVEVVMEKIAEALTGVGGGTGGGISEMRNRTWVTRRGVKVDRMASAWLIRRFIDPKAEFRFVAAEGYQPGEGEIRFDMFEGEFTHEGELCTFEVLLRRVGLRDAALEAIGQVVHDIDLKDGKYQRPETAGIAAMVDGIAALHGDDARRIEEGARVFEAAYAALRAGA